MLCEVSGTSCRTVPLEPSEAFEGSAGSLHQLKRRRAKIWKVKG